MVRVPARSRWRRFSRRFRASNWLLKRRLKRLSPFYVATLRASYLYLAIASITVFAFWVFGLLYDYQTFLAGLLAVVAGVITVGTMTLHKRMEIDTRNLRCVSVALAAMQENRIQLALTLEGLAIGKRALYKNHPSRTIEERIFQFQTTIQRPIVTPIDQGLTADLSIIEPIHFRGIIMINNQMLLITEHYHQLTRMKIYTEETLLEYISLYESTIKNSTDFMRNTENTMRRFFDTPVRAYYGYRAAIDAASQFEEESRRVRDAIGNPAADVEDSHPEPSAQ